MASLPHSLMLSIFFLFSWSKYRSSFSSALATIKIFLMWRLNKVRNGPLFWCRSITRIGAIRKPIVNSLKKMKESFLNQFPSYLFLLTVSCSQKEGTAVFIGIWTNHGQWVAKKRQAVVAFFSSLLTSPHGIIWMLPSREALKKRKRRKRRKVIVGTKAIVAEKKVTSCSLLKMA